MTKTPASLRSDPGRFAPLPVAALLRNHWPISVEYAVRGKENEARKVAMYLVSRCCDLTLSETARVFGLGSYGAVGWVCHGVKAKMAREKKFREQMERIAAEICQQKI